ncbi:MAG: hypothetical protein WAO35_22645 [Terriglobia bacterium]
MADQITNLFDQTLADLIAGRDSQYANEIAPLESERETLAAEYGAIEEARGNLEKVLPAMRREAERQADGFLVIGEREKAEAKLAEAERAEHAPQEMAARQKEISARVEAIQKQEHDIARRTFEAWYAEVQHVSRAVEQGHFIVFLDGLEKSFRDFQERTDTGASNNRQGPLIRQAHIAGLTGPERSAEWQAGNRWYGGRR